MDDQNPNAFTPPPAAPVPPPQPQSQPQGPPPPQGPAGRPYYPYPQPPAKSSAWIGWLIVVILLCCVIMFCFLMIAGLAAGASSQTAEGTDEFPSFTETVSWGDDSADDKKVIRLQLSGAIMRGGDGGLLGPGRDRIEEVLLRIRAATNDADVSGIIFEVNSPGGAVTPSDEIYNALLDFKKADKNRKIIVHVRDLAASGGYYAAMASDHIMAEPTAIIGSIGVIMTALNFKGLADKIGVTDTTIKSGDNKDLLNPLREVRPEQVAILQEMIDSMQARFESIVVSGRAGHLTAEELKKLADGRVFDATSAQANGLIDSIGYWNDCITQMETMMGGSITVIQYDRAPSGFLEVLSSAEAPVLMPNVMNASTPKFMYYWRP